MAIHIVPFRVRGWSTSIVPFFPRAGKETAMQNASEPPVLLDLASQPRFIHTLPLPRVIDTAETPGLTLQMRQTAQWLGLVDEAGNPLLTTVWGFGTPDGETTAPGPTLITYSDQALQVLWENKLP